MWMYVLVFIGTSTNVKDWRDDIMPVEYKDYYAILGVSRDAKPDDIRKAYRKLAKEYHPDVNKTAGAEDKYKEINEAYEVLKDPAKREKYDRLGANWRNGQDFTPPEGWGGNFSGGTFTAGGDFSDFFRTIFGGGGSFGGFQDIFSGGMHHQARNTDTEAELTLTLEQVYRGGEMAMSLNGRTLNVRLPRGITNGSRIKLAGKGANGGDLYVNVHIAPHKDFSVEGADITRDVHVHVWDAVLGDEVSVRTLDGTVSVRMPAGIQDGQKLRLKGKGLPKRDGSNGDMYVRVRIDIPKALTPQQKKLWQDLASLG